MLFFFLYDQYFLLSQCCLVFCKFITYITIALSLIFYAKTVTKTNLHQEWPACKVPDLGLLEEHCPYKLHLQHQVQFLKI